MSIFQSIKNFNIENKDDLVSITINENNIDYLKTDKFNIDILEDLVESKAYATAMLYLNENCILNTKTSSLDDINSFYKECEDLLDTNITIVEEKGIPLCDICGYKIYEGAGYILRGNGSKKIKECFLTEKASIDWNNYLTPEEVAKFLSKDNKFEVAREIVDSEEFKPRYNDLHNTLQAKYKNSWEKDELVKDLVEFYNFGHLITEDTEGVQTDDIAPKVDQDLGTTPAKPEKKKYYDILLSGLDESMDSIVNKGFMKNSQGQYERNGYILVRDGQTYKAINKNKINI
jgi:hypothetical protein